MQQKLLHNKKKVKEKPLFTNKRLLFAKFFSNFLSYFKNITYFCNLNVNFKALLAILHADTLLIILNNIMRKILLTMMALIAGTTLSFADDSYELVTSESSLAAGDEVLIVFVSGSTYYAMGGSTTNGRSGVNASSFLGGDDFFTLPSSNTSISRFTLGGSSGAWTFYSDTNTTGYLAKSGTTSNSTLTTLTSSTNNCKVVLTISNTGATSFNFNNSRNRYLTYSYSFSLTGSSNTNIRIFKKVPIPNAPTFSLEEGEYSSTQSVKLSTTTSGATIFYTTDGSTPTTNSIQYTGAITIGEGTTTIKAIAVYKGVSSDVATATYVVNLPEKETFHLVTNAAALAEGDTIIIVYSPYGKVMGDQISEGNRVYTKFNIADESIIMLKENTAATRVVLGGSASAWTFRAINNTEGFLYNSGTEGYLNTQATAGDYAKATVKIASNGNATITFNAEGNNKLLAYYLDPDAGPGGDDPTPPIVGAPRRAPVAGSDVVECFTFIDAFNEDNGYFPVQIYSKNPHEVVTTDINQDGQWDVADVTALVNYLLDNNSNNIDVSACDIDGSGTVDADDIPALINLILEQ